jgi:hypothetical protein
MQRASRQHRDRELRLRARALSGTARAGAAAWGALLLAVATATLAVTAAAAETKVYESEEFHFSVALPAECRHEQGPGTLDAVCSPDLDAQKSKEASAAAALLLEVSAERVPEEAGKQPEELAQRYGEAQFKAELPETVCGDPDPVRVKVGGAKQVLEAARVVYTADVVCPEIRFLALGERRATVQYLLTPGVRFRLMARAPTDDLEQRKEEVEAFFASFRLLPGSK